MFSCWLLLRPEPLAHDLKTSRVLQCIQYVAEQQAGGPHYHSDPLTLACSPTAVLQAWLHQCWVEGRITSLDLHSNHPPHAAHDTVNFLWHKGILLAQLGIHQDPHTSSAELQRLSCRNTMWGPCRLHAWGHRLQGWGSPWGMPGRSLWRFPDVTRGCCSEACANVQGSSRAIPGKAHRQGNRLAPAACGSKQRPLSDLQKGLRGLSGVLSALWIGSLLCLGV